MLYKVLTVYIPGPLSIIERSNEIGCEFPPLFLGVFSLGQGNSSGHYTAMATHGVRCRA